MWIKALKICAISVSQIIITSFVFAETVELRSGKVLVGEVCIIGEEKIVVEARFPETRTINIEYDDLTPVSLYRVLERRIDPRKPSEHLKLGEFAEKTHMNGIAIAEYTAVKQLDKNLEKEMNERITRLRKAIALDILDDAQNMLEEGNPNGALMYLHTILCSPRLESAPLFRPESTPPSAQ